MAKNFKNKDKMNKNTLALYNIDFGQSVLKWIPYGDQPGYNYTVQYPPPKRLK